MKNILTATLATLALAAITTSIVQSYSWQNRPTVAEQIEAQCGHIPDTIYSSATKRKCEKTARKRIADNLMEGI